MVPEGWSVLPLGKMAEFRNGLNFSKGDEGDAIKIVTIPDFWQRTEMLDLTDVKSIQPKGKVPSASLLQSGDMLFVRSNGNPELVGRCLFFPDVSEPVSYSGFTIRGRVDQSQLVPEFAASVMLTERTKEQFRRGRGGGNISNLSQDILAGVQVALPPLPEQRKIADILSTWDRAIEVSEALLATAQTQKRALMQSLLTGKRRFPEFEGQEWKEVRLGDVAQISMGSSPKSSAYNQDGIGLPLIQGNADIKNGWSAPRSFTSETTTICKPNDILLSVRAPVGTIAISGHHACVGRGAAVITPKAGYSWSWLKHVMIDLNPKWVRVSQGSTFDAVNSKDIKSFKIMAPSSLKEQDRIGEAMEVTEWEINSLTDQITKLRTEKKALMQQLLTGKRRVVV